MAPPLPPKVARQSPVKFFRDLLAMNGVERAAALTNRSPESRKTIMAKLREYSALDADERELRLRVTELRWYLWPLINVPATNRAVELMAIPADYRALVSGRLRAWDGLSLEVRKQLLENETTIRYFTEIEGLSAERARGILDNMKPDQRQRLQEGIDKWNALSEDERSALTGRFNQFFELNDRERQRALKTLSTQERRQIEKTLEAFGRLPAEEREQCIRSFEKFANLSLVQRDLFLRNAERWRVMTPSERQAWRDLVKRIPAELPPLPPELPPLPQVVRSVRPDQTGLTNRD